MKPLLPAFEYSCTWQEAKATTLYQDGTEGFHRFIGSPRPACPKNILWCSDSLTFGLSHGYHHGIAELHARAPFDLVRLAAFTLPAVVPFSRGQPQLIVQRTVIALAHALCQSLFW